MKPTILLQLDTDPQPSVFDSVVAIDAGVERLLRHGGVNPDNVRDLVHGALFTRGLGDLHRTAIFVGGSNVAAGDQLLEAIRKTFFGPFHVSVLIDSNGSNTTAASAVLAALKACDGSLKGRKAAVLGGTGPVGQRVGRLLAREGASVTLVSRSEKRATDAARLIQEATGGAVTGAGTEGENGLVNALQDVELVVAAGAAGVVLLPAETRRSLPDLKNLIDLNAVPPLGIEGVEPTDRDTAREGTRAWGALGIGGTKMKIHRQAIEELFVSNDLVLDAEEVFALGRDRLKS